MGDGAATYGYDQLNRERRFIGYGHQYIADDDIASVVNVLKSDFLTQGPVVEQFERTLAEYVGARYVVAVSSGTAALHIACLAAGVKPGVCAFTSPLTFVATANAPLYCGGKVRLVDVDQQSLCMAPESLRKSLEAKDNVKVVLPVHFAGLASATERIREIADGSIVIEDGCHALGGCYEDGQMVGCGAFSDMCTFSFHPVKPITTGEGGAIATNDAELDHRLRLYRSHGIERNMGSFLEAEADRSGPWWYEQQCLGYNYRMSDIQAALGLSQLSKLDRFISRRRQIAKFYDEEFRAMKHVSLPQSKPKDRERSGHHLYVVEVDFEQIGQTRQDVMNRLREKGIGTQVHYIPVYYQPYHAKSLGGGVKEFPNSEAYYRQCLSLPIHAGQTDEEAAYVATEFKRTLSE